MNVTTIARMGPWDVIATSRMTVIAIARISGLPRFLALCTRCSPRVLYYAPPAPPSQIRAVGLTVSRKTAACAVNDRRPLGLSLSLISV